MNWTDDDLNLALRDLREEPLPPGAAEAVRARVLAQLEKPRRRWLRWAWAPALAASLAIWFAIPGEQPHIAPPPVLAQAPQAPALVPPPAPTLKSTRPRTATRPTETRFVKLVTDDPDVVILWAMNSEGDAQ